MIGSLTARIFAIFWLTLALVLMLVLMLPKLDSRQMTELLDSEQRQGLMIEQHVEAELANDPPNDLMAAWNWSVRSPCVMAKIITNFI